MMYTETIKLESVITDIAAGPFGSNLKVSCFVDYGFPIIDGANLKGFKVTDNVTKFVTEEKARSLHRSIAKRNDVIVTISGTLGQIAYIPENSMFEEYLCSQRQFRVSFDTERVFVPYLVYYFHSREGQHKILSFANQTGVPALSQPLKNFRNIEVDLPDIDTQKQIASVLLSLDDKIELNTAINENLEQQAQALFKNLIADIQERVPFTSVIQVLGGGTPKTGKQEYWNGEIPFFTPKDVGAPYVLTTEKSITPLGLDNCNSRLYPVNTVFLTARGTVGKVSLAGVPMSMNQSCYALAGKDGLHQIIVYHYVLETVKALKHKASGAVFDAIITRDFDTESVPALSSEQIDSFIAVAEPIYSDILNRTIENQRLAALRDTLLPKLMNGEIDVSAVKI
ncbi:restriction endonuclease subunit S [Ruminococcus flavefaciens]|uniref:restriction endonuclease subunit S n=1 Tax=Ruminococcus flavefaciens TaxID=1265 RepID=UPI0026ED849D|nr:restriction endonuclease subunit S [Ruminococcus flavefaciens]MDD7518113.1 restriction endonuclease subunit S [Ruminococcus flavefaciens]MDY5690786.1 restriction endonuclease subunit S [Ruminococcus flavefaciens]